MRSKSRTGLDAANLPRREDSGLGTSFDFIPELPKLGLIRFAFQGRSQSKSGTFDVAKRQLGLCEEKMRLGIFGFLLERLAEIIPGLGGPLILQRDHSQVIQRPFVFRIETQRRLVKTDRFGLV